MYSIPPPQSYSSVLSLRLFGASAKKSVKGALVALT